jgi:predicted RNA-binding protein
MKQSDKNIATLSDLVFDDKNFNAGTENGQQLLEKSLRQFGAGRSILIDKNNRIIAGNKTVEQATNVGLKDVVIVETTGDKIVAVKRTDIDLDSPQGRELALADNAVAVADIEWDLATLGAVTSEWDIEPSEWGVELETDKKRTFPLAGAEHVCDMSDALKVHRRGEFAYVSFWENTETGWKLSDIKSDPKSVETFSTKSIDMIQATLGYNLSAGDWSIVTTPRRRHKELHFATEICKKISEVLKIPFYEDVIVSRTKNRLKPEFTVVKVIKENNVIVFDDIATTGMTLKATHDVLSKRTLRKNCFFIVGISNTQVLTETGREF